MKGDEDAPWLGRLTVAERALVEKIARVNVDSTRRVNTLLWVVGLLWGAGLLVQGLVSGDMTARYAGIFTLILAPVMAIVRSRVLELYLLIGKLLGELERLRPRNSHDDVSDV